MFSPWYWLLFAGTMFFLSSLDTIDKETTSSSLSLLTNCVVAMIAPVIFQWLFFSILVNGVILIWENGRTVLYTATMCGFVFFWWTITSVAQVVWVVVRFLWNTFATFDSDITEENFSNYTMDNDHVRKDGYTTSHSKSRNTVDSLTSLSNKVQVQSKYNVPFSRHHVNKYTSSTMYAMKTPLTRRRASSHSVYKTNSVSPPPPWRKPLKGSLSQEEKLAIIAASWAEWRRAKESTDE
jgi:hypothetical protein